MRDLVEAALNLKNVRRQGWVDAGIEHAESVADHSYATSIIAMLISDDIGLDTGRVIRMALLHDIAESIVGDIVPGNIDTTKKHRKEQAAIKRILRDIPKPLGDTYLDIWQEYLACSTPEARLVHEADKLDMGLQASQYQRMLDTATIQSFLESAHEGIERGKAAGIIPKDVSRV